ncbi:conserved hypothetical protein [Candidatus Sulfopaludibacter sp. SbA4]|nr:conserved hypothetical protein [Candidatus Sulfopaludibacter sp. SbA4]
MAVEKLKLKDNHTWKCKPGYSVCVLDRGLVRFDFPSNWIVEPDEGAVHLHDRPPSVESCDLGASIFRVPAEHVRELSLDDALRDSLGNDRTPYQQSEIHHIVRGDLEIAWLEQRYNDAEYKRDARFRVALARGPVLCLISMNYWSNRAPGLERVWDEVLRTLVMGVMVADPTSSPVVQ